jgi:hypothetical protein
MVISVPPELGPLIGLIPSIVWLADAELTVSSSISAATATADTVSTEALRGTVAFVMGLYSLLAGASLLNRGLRI